MKHKIKLYILSISLTCLTAFAQNETLKKYTKKISQPYKEGKTFNSMYNGLKVSNTTFSKGKEILTCKIQIDDIIIQKIDSEKLAVLKENKYNNFFAKNFYIVNCIELNDKYFVFYSSWDEDAKKEQVFSAEIDFDKCEFVGVPKLLLQVDGKVSPYNTYHSYFNLTESFNKKSIAINYWKISEKNKGDKKAKEIIGVKKYDENLNPISSNEIEMPYREKEPNYRDYNDLRLNNNGDFYWLAKVFHDDSRNDKKKRKDLTANFHFEICSIKSNAKTIGTIKIEDKDNVINTLSLFTTPKDFMVCGGTYSNGSSDIMDTDGYVGFKISSDGTIYDKVYNEFTLEVLKQYETEKTQRNIDKVRIKGDSNELTKVSLQDVYVCENGDFVFFGEQNYTYGSMSDPGNSSNNISKVSSVPFYMDIIVSKVKPNGNVVWVNKIPKNEIAVTSYWHVISNNDYYFIFVDDIHNINLPLNKKPDAAYGGHDEYMSIVKISDPEGSVSKGEIFSNDDFKNYDIKKYMVNVRNPFKVSENEIMLEINQIKNGSGDVMIKVNLD